jgi:hypothetical protein
MLATEVKSIAAMAITAKMLITFSRFFLESGIVSF